MKRHKLERELNEAKTSLATLQRDRANKCADYLGIYEEVNDRPILSLDFEDHKEIFELIFQYMEEYYLGKISKLEEYLSEVDVAEELYQYSSY